MRLQTLLCGPACRKRTGRRPIDAGARRTGRGQQSPKQLDAVTKLEAAYGAKFPKAVAKITDDIGQPLSFHDHPAEHWIHLRTTNPIESTFATVRNRSKITKGPGSRARGNRHGLQADRGRPITLARCERTPSAVAEMTSPWDSLAQRRAQGGAHTATSGDVIRAQPRMHRMRTGGPDSSSSSTRVTDHAADQGVARPLAHPHDRRRTGCATWSPFRA